MSGKARATAAAIALAAILTSHPIWPPKILNTCSLALFVLIGARLRPGQQRRPVAGHLGRFAAAAGPNLTEKTADSEEGRRSGGNRLRERIDLGHPGSHVAMEAARELKRVHVVGRMDEDGGGASLP